MEARTFKANATGQFLGHAMFKVGMMSEAARLTLVTHQTNEALILDTCAEMRKCEPMADRPGLGRWALSIPFVKWLEIRRKYPDLASDDAQVKSRAYARFMASAESMPYRVPAGWARDAQCRKPRVYPWRQAAPGDPAAGAAGQGAAACSDHHAGSA
jgi:hypothetical protein